MAKVKEKEVKSKIYIGSRTFDVVLIIVMGLLSVIFIYPFLNVLAISLSGNGMIVTGQVTFYPRDIIFEGYKMLFREENIFRAYGNTIVIAAGGALLSLTLTSLLAYVMMVPDFVLKKPLSYFLLITMFFSGGTVPGYILIRNLGLYNTWWALILPGAVSAYNVFVYRAFFKGISLELREAAKIDGASEFGILTRIYVPLAKALYATFGMMSVVGTWNSYFSSLLYIEDPKKQPIQISGRWRDSIWRALMLCTTRSFRALRRRSISGLPGTATVSSSISDWQNWRFPLRISRRIKKEEPSARFSAITAGPRETA